MDIKFIITFSSQEKIGIEIILVIKFQLKESEQKSSLQFVQNGNE